jgi:segregation and condensation protein B
MNETMPDIAQLKRIFEAALLGAGQPLTVAQLAALFDELEAPTHEDIARTLEELRNDAADRGVELVEVASGFRYQVREDVHAFVSRLWTERQTRYSRALLETLALIAYRQPITRAEIEQIRGVGVASSIVKTLEEREWVRVVGYRDLPGKPALFGTTKAFLDYFNLKSLDQLPPLSEIRDIEELDPQLAFATDGAIPATLGDDVEAGASSANADASNDDARDDDDHAANDTAHDETPAHHEEPTEARHEDAPSPDDTVDADAVDAARDDTPEHTA